MGAENNSDSKRTPRWILDIWKILRNWVVLPLLGALLGAMLIGRIIDWVIGPKTYKIYVVGNFEDGGAAASIWDGISKGGSLGKIDGIPVELEKGNDFGDPLSAQRISIDLASRNDLLAVVGHFASTQTKAALPAYLRTANPPIPVILTTETNPNLLPPKPRETIYDPVFRLSPTDDDQASKAAAFAIAATCTRLLGRGGYDQSGIFRFSGKEVQRTRSGEFKSGVAMDQQLSLPPVQTISTLNVDWVFFAGTWQDALILVRQLRAMPGGHTVNVILSDSSVDPRLVQQGGAAVNGVYLTHPMLAETYNGPTGYGVYGSDAFQLSQQLLDSANDQFSQLASANGGLGYWYRHLLGLRRATDVRNVFAAVMKDAALREHKFSLDGTPCSFRGDGTRANASFHVWQVQNGKFVTVQ